MGVCPSWLHSFQEAETEDGENSCARLKGSVDGRGEEKGTE